MNRDKLKSFIMRQRQRNKKNIILIIVWNIILIFLIVFVQNNVQGQYHKPPTAFKTIITKGWAMDVNFGRTSFFGEVSLYDEQFNEKLSKEGSWAYGFIVSKKITRVFALEGQLILGKLKGSNSSSHFVADIMEYTGNLTANLVNLFIPDNSARFNPYVKVGLGQFKFSTELVFNDANTANIRTESASPESLMIFGGGAFYSISNNFNIKLEMTGRRINNDQLDGSKNNSKDNDYYSYTSIGLSYKINNNPHDTRYYKRMGMKSPLIKRR
jgi:opacity protein-like surface antigen